jgi:hypothetical protein
MPEPNFQDRVKHKTSGIAVTGIVVAKYPNTYFNDLKDLRGTEWLLDVRSDEHKIIYATPAENWETISTEEERFE